MVGSPWRSGDRGRPRPAAGGRITFFVGGSEGERHDSTWQVIAADPPHQLELRDADVDDDARPNDENAMTALVITMEERPGRGAPAVVSGRGPGVGRRVRQPTA